jgi:hypothetical protein
VIVALFALIVGACSSTSERETAFTDAAGREDTNAASRLDASLDGGHTLSPDAVPDSEAMLPADAPVDTGRADGSLVDAESSKDASMCISSQEACSIDAGAPCCYGFVCTLSEPHVCTVTAQ